MDFNEFFEYFVTGAVTILILSLAAFIIWGIFFSSNEVINTITTVIGVVALVTIILVFIGIFVKEHVFG